MPHHIGGWTTVAGAGHEGSSDMSGSPRIDLRPGVSEPRVQLAWIGDRVAPVGSHPRVAPSTSAILLGRAVEGSVYAADAVAAGAAEREQRDEE